MGYETQSVAEETAPDKVQVVAEPRKESRPGRLHTIPPAPPVSRWTQQLTFLEETGTDLLAVLWRVLRRIDEWVEADPDGREALFGFDKKASRHRLAHACAHAPDLVEAFGTFAMLVRAPGKISATQIAEACQQVYEWAEEHSQVLTAMLFAEAAASVDPENPAYAINAGWMSRRAARDERSESWYLRAFRLAVRTKNQPEAIRALTGYGALMKDLGRHDEARRYYEKAAQRAINYGFFRRAAVAHHYLLGLEAEVGTYRRAERHVRRALDLYPISDPQLPALAHDFGFLLVRLHCYTPAIPLLEMALPRIQLPEIQTAVWGTLARALAGARRRNQFEEVEQELLPLVRLHEEYAPAALVHLAEGARTFGRWDHAEQYARTAKEIARSQKNALLERDALELLDRIALRELAPREEEPVERERIEKLTRRLKARFRKWKAPDLKTSETHPKSDRDSLASGGT